MPAEIQVHSRTHIYTSTRTCTRTCTLHTTAPTFTNLAEPDDLALSAVAAVATVGHLVGDDAAEGLATATLGL